MKCCGRLSESSQRDSSDVIVGGLSKLSSKKDLKNEIYKIFRHARIRNILRDIFFDNRKASCE